MPVVIVVRRYCCTAFRMQLPLFGRASSAAIENMCLVSMYAGAQGADAAEREELLRRAAGGGAGALQVRGREELPHGAVRKPHQVEMIRVCHARFQRCGCATLGWSEL
jgi:hypothetical protein